MSSIKDKWNAIYSKNTHGFFPPAMVLHRNKHLLPKRGKALDLACGTGRNAIYLSQAGFETHAWDASDVAIDSLIQYCQETNLTIHTRVIEITEETLDKESFDVIIVSHFLDRDLMTAIMSALKPSGLIFYQTFIHDKVADIGPNNPDYLLAENELLQLFSAFTIRSYQEEGTIGNTEHGIRNEALLIAEKP